MEKWYQKTGSEALGSFGVTTDGLSSEKAAELLKKNGENKLAEGKKKTIPQVFLSQFADLLVIILIVAAIISMFSGNIESTIVIFAVIILNAVLGFVQEYRTEKTLETLRSMTAPTAKVYRGGILTELPAEELVPGDVISIEAGDCVPADCLLRSASRLYTNESILTGEAEPVEKSAAPPDARSEELLRMGLDVPQVTSVCMKLRQMGLALPESIYTLDQALSALEGLRKGGVSC